MIGNWDQTKMSEGRKGVKNYISMNREGVKQGYICPKVNGGKRRKLLSIENQTKSLLKLRKVRSSMM